MATPTRDIPSQRKMINNNSQQRANIRVSNLSNIRVYKTLISETVIKPAKNHLLGINTNTENSAEVVITMDDSTGTSNTDSYSTFSHSRTSSVTTEPNSFSNSTDINQSIMDRDAFNGVDQDCTNSAAAAEEYSSQSCKPWLSQVLGPAVPEMCRNNGFFADGRSCATCILQACGANGSLEKLHDFCGI